MLASIILGILFSFSWIKLGQRPRSSPENVFLVNSQELYPMGETLEYDVHFHFAFISKKVASVTTRIAGQTMIRGEDCYHLVLEVRSEPFPIFVPAFHWKFYSFVTKENLLTQRFEKWITSEGKTKHMEIEFDQVAHLAYWPDTTIKILPDTRDWVAACYATRRLDIKSFKSGDMLYTASIEEDKKEVKRLIVKIKDVRREKLKMAGREHNTYYFKIDCFDPLSNEGGEMEVWFTVKDGIMAKMQKNGIIAKTSYGRLIVERKFR